MVRFDMVTDAPPPKPPAVFSENVDALKETTAEYIEAVKLQQDVKAQNASIEEAFRDFEKSSKDIIKEISILNVATIEQIVESTKTISDPFVSTVSDFEAYQKEGYSEFFNQLQQSHLELIAILKQGDNTEESLQSLINSQENLINTIENLKLRNTEIIELVKDNEDLVKYP